MSLQCSALAVAFFSPHAASSSRRRQWRLSSKPGAAQACRRASWHFVVFPACRMVFLSFWTAETHRAPLGRRCDGVCMPIRPKPASCPSPASTPGPRTALGSQEVSGSWAMRNPGSDSEPATGHRHRSEPAGSCVLSTGEASCRSRDTQGSPSCASPRVSQAPLHPLTPIISMPRAPVTMARLCCCLPHFILDQSLLLLAGICIDASIERDLRNMHPRILPWNVKCGIVNRGLGAASGSLVGTKGRPARYPQGGR